jgi:hypothetical protein
LRTQKERIQQLQTLLQTAKSSYSTALKNLEFISDSIHKMRGDLGVREPGVGAESNDIPPPATDNNDNLDFNLDDIELESRTHSRSTSRSVNEIDTESVEGDDVEALRAKVRTLAARPLEGGDGKQDEQENWESELNATVDKLDHLMLLRERTQESFRSEPQSPIHHDQESKTIKQLQKLDPLPLAIVSLQTLPTSSSALPFNSKFLAGSMSMNCDNLVNKKRKLSLG